MLRAETMPVEQVPSSFHRIADEDNNVIDDRAQVKVQMSCRIGLPNI